MDGRRAERPLHHEHELTKQLLSSSFDGILAFDAEYRYTWWNPAMERLSGMAAERVLGRRAFDVFPFLVETGEDWYFREALAGRTAISRDRGFIVPESGRQGVFEGYYSPIRKACGSIAGGLAVIRDVTERKRAEEERLALARAEEARARAEQQARHFAFLASASEILWSSLDYEEMLGRLARLAVPTLGDLCIVDVVEEDRLRRVAVAHVNSAKAAVLEELRRRYPPALDSPQPAGHVLRTGEPHLLAQVDSDVITQHTMDADHAALIGAIDIRSHLAVPVLARGRVLGALSLGITESDRRYGPDDVTRAADIAHRAALAIENTRLFATAQTEIAERGRTESALRLSELRFRAVFEQSPLSIQIFSPGGTPLQVNRAWEELWGATLDRIPDYNVLADPQLEARGIAPLIQRAFAGEPVAIPAVRYDPNETLPDRSYHADPVRWVRAFAYPIKENDDVREVVLVHEDVTAEMRAQQALRASEERLRLALTGARMNVWDWDLATNRLECSENAIEFWGIAAGDAEEFLAVVHPDDVPAVRRAAERAIAGEEPYHSEYRLLSPDGRTRWVQSRGRLECDDTGRAVRILGITMDISEIKAAEQALQILADAGQALCSSLDYHSTLDQLAQIAVPRLADWCAVDLLGEGGRLERVAVNHAEPAKVALGRALFARHPPRRSDRYGAGRVVRTGEPEWSPEITDEILQAVANDRDHLAALQGLGLRSYVCVPLQAPDRVIGVLTLVHAESGRRYNRRDVELAMELGRRAAAAVDNARLYQQLRAEDRRKDEFLATLAHELRNPLAPIRSGLDVLKTSGDSSFSIRAREVMERQVEHMVRLIDDLLDLSRVTRGKIELHRERIDLWTVIGNALETSRPIIDAAGLELEVRLPTEPLVLDADRTRIAQVISNLLNNAAKYTERGGRVTVSATLEGADAVIEVSDTGIGIPQEMLGQVFEMFAQLGQPPERGQGGLGIGLPLARRLVELHGGRVWAESEGPGRGSTFVVHLPTAVATPAHQSAPAAQAARASATARRVLVADDNEDAAQLLASLLTLAGHEVVTAANGPAALELLRESVPDICFLDIGMPGMSGYELARCIRADTAFARTTLVAVTGWGQTEDRRRSAEAGFDHHLMKPVDARDIHVLVASAPQRR